MAGGGSKYKLVGILIADIRGYCRLLGDIAEAIVRTFKAYRSAFNDLTRQYHQRIVDSPEDNIMSNPC